MRSLITRIGTALAIAFVFGTVVAPNASANYVYWPNIGGTSIGRVGIDGSGVNNSFLTTAPSPTDPPFDVAVDAKHIYWAHGNDTTGAIGRANLDGTGADPNFIPHSAGPSIPQGVTVTASHIYWLNVLGTIGRANIDGSAPNGSFITLPNESCDLDTDGKFLYFSSYPPGTAAIGRVPIGGGTPDGNFIPVPDGKDCGVAVDSAHVYFTSPSSHEIRRANIDGTNVDPNFISGIVAYGLAVTPQYVFWGSGYTDHSVGRAAIDGSGKNQLFAVAGDNPAATPYLLAASPSNQFSVGKAKLNKKNGTAKVTVTVPGPGVLVADAASKGAQAVASKKKKASTVRRVQKTASGAATLTLKIRANGKALKALRKKHKAKVKVGITFTPQGAAGVPALTTKKIALKRS